MEDIGLIIDLFLTLGIALLGGMVARRLGMPVLIGYILAGIAIGPQTPGLVAHADRVELLANLGVVFLMFALGVEFSLNELAGVRKIAFPAAAVQMPLSILLGFLVGLALGWDIRAAILLGLAFLACSSIVVIKVTLGRGEATSPHARAALGLGIVQDLSMVPLLALLPLLESNSGGVVMALVQSLGTAAIALILVVVVGTRLVPIVFNYVAVNGTRELFLLTILVIALGTAFAAHEAGLSLALGAFLAGLVVSESHFDTHVLAEIIPLRDVFSTLFFVALGMLLDPRVFLDDPLRIAMVVIVLVGGKAIISTAGFLVSGVGPVLATKAGLLTSQIGEFSFLLASIGFSHAIIENDQYSFILAIALSSILATPLLLMAQPAITAFVERLPLPKGEMASAIHDDTSYSGLRDHVIISGHGRVGQALSETLIRRNLPFSVIDMNPAVVQDLLDRGIPALYGDGTTEPVLERAGITHARILAVTVPNTVVAARASRIARIMNAEIDIIVRAARAVELPELREAGANEIVQPEFEAGLEFLQHVLHYQGVSRNETQVIMDRRRRRYYREREGEPFGLESDT
jgi:monovalent cation:H+ antiporter-2, CPA2 family